MKSIVIGSDHGGFALKDSLVKYMQRSLGMRVKDMGTFSEESCDYPQYAYAVAQAVSAGKFSRGILICKSGIGNSIVANKLPRVRAALCYNETAAELSRQHNDSNVLVLGSRFVDEATAKKILKVWLTTKFEGGRHRRRVGQIRNIELEMGCS